MFKKFCSRFPKLNVINRHYSSNSEFGVELDFEYLCNPSNQTDIKQNILKRKGIGDIDRVLEIHKAWETCTDLAEKNALKKKLLNIALKIPNKSHPDIDSLDEEPLVVKIIGEERIPKGKVKQFHEIASKLNTCRTEKISNYTGHRSYYFLDDLAALEQALIKYSLNYLSKLKFRLVSVPDILPRNVIEACGMDTRGDRHQVYSLSNKHYGDLCLSGTAEMGIAYFLRGKTFDEYELPLKIAAVSRCFRAETSKIAEEKGVYRVHQFTKVEMFGVSLPSHSDSLLAEFVSIQEDIYNSLGLKLRTLDMPPSELGAQASRKYDVEAWLPGRQMWGEISSASNCTDYQSRRLSIKTSNGYAHTINGTACAIPRLIIALLETHQMENGSVELPNILSEFLQSLVIRTSRLPKFTEFKTRERFA